MGVRSIGSVGLKIEYELEFFLLVSISFALSILEAVYFAYLDDTATVLTFCLGMIHVDDRLDLTSLCVDKW